MIVLYLYMLYSVMSVFEWYAICISSVVFYLYLSDLFCNDISKYIPIMETLARWQLQSILNSDDSVLLQFVQGKILQIVIYEQWRVTLTGVSALVFKVFFFVFWMKL